MKFSEYKYTRPEIASIISKMKDARERFSKVHEYVDQKKIFEEVSRLRKEMDTAENVVYIRYTIDTRDSFYQEEKEFFDESSPLVEEAFSEFLEVLLSSENLSAFKTDYGHRLFDLYGRRKKVFSPEILADIQKENRLSSEYSKILGSAEIEYKGKKRSLSDFSTFLESTDRATRKEASEVFFGFFLDHQEEIDSVYDQLVKLRHEMAKKLGYENFVQMGYDRLGRTDYTSEDVKKYREQIQRVLVPLVEEMNEEKKKVLGVDHLYYYDQSINFKDGEPKPSSDAKELVQAAAQMYQQMDPVMGDFFSLMVENQMMDLEAKVGKAPGGYCTFVEGLELPFIFSNFNGSSGDVDVLTHEFGHALQSYLSRKISPIDLRFPGYEACEVHSMSMEYLTHPQMERFFKEEADKYRYTHISSALAFLPYGVLIDEFQHWVYEHPEVTPKERRAAYREIEKKYKPSLDYEDNVYLNEGGFWHKQGHLFGTPFYYIDYTLAQIVAFEIYSIFLDDQKKAMEVYLKLCKMGGRYGFVQMLERAGLRLPFHEGSVQKSVEALVEERKELEKKVFNGI